MGNSLEAITLPLPRMVLYYGSLTQYFIFKTRSLETVFHVPTVCVYNGGGDRTTTLVDVHPHYDVIYGAHRWHPKFQIETDTRSRDARSEKVKMSFLPCLSTASVVFFFNSRLRQLIAGNAAAAYGAEDECTLARNDGLMDDCFSSSYFR